MVTRGPLRGLSPHRGTITITQLNVYPFIQHFSTRVHASFCSTTQKNAPDLFSQSQPAAVTAKRGGPKAASES